MLAKQAQKYSRLTALMQVEAHGPHSSRVTAVAMRQVLTAEEAAAAPPSLRNACMPSSVPSGLQDLRMEHLLGKGPYGHTYLGAYKGAPVAVKVWSSPCALLPPQGRHVV